jgi:hypothetical protein
MNQLHPESLLPPTTLPPRVREPQLSSSQQWLVSVGSLSSVALTFVEAIHRLGSRALATVRAGLTPGQWLALTAIVVGFVYAEGYRALQRKFAPLVVSRVLEIGSRPVRIHTPLSAPLYSLSLIDAPRAVLARAWLAVALIACAVCLVRALPNPWRGLIDAGVAAALTWGLCALLIEFSRRTR